MEDLPRTNGPLSQNGVNPDATAHRLRKRKPQTPSPPPIFVQDLSLPYIPPPKRVVLLPGTADACPPVMYKSLALLLADLNKLLNTPHEDRAFHFKGACTIVADPSIGSGDRVRRVAWEVIRRTVVAFNIHALTIENGTFGALTTAQSSALWMSSPPASLAIATVPCRKCEHIFTIGAEPCVSAPTPISTPEARVQLSGQRIMVVLRHLPT
ncbi:hypothetical protein C8R43DRAFT_497125 [Mycena crocata]|nr:hypothetical protein C8R43DRAFT_497125 [Mycena crocata]